MKVALQTSVRLIASLALISYKQKYLSQSAKWQVGWEERESKGIHWCRFLHILEILSDCAVRCLLFHVLQDIYILMLVIKLIIYPLYTGLNCCMISLGT